MSDRRSNGGLRLAAPSSLIIQHSSFRPAFTLVELMMSLIIIGLLVSMLGVAIGFAVNKAKQARVSTEISNLDVALQSYKSQFGGEFPPCMGFKNNVPARADLFNRAIRKHFPRCTMDYATIATLLYQGSTTPPIPKWQVRSISNPGNLIPLDLSGTHTDGLDPAEALVFWLAGPPTPVDASGNPVAPTVLYGFSANPTNPFSITGSRLPALFEFDETRLTDVDNDGWPEYVPPITSNKTIYGAAAVAPYVYFDDASYSTTVTVSGKPVTLVATYPAATYGAPQAWPTLPIAAGIAPGSALAGSPMFEFGRAVPYPTQVGSISPVTATFWNPKKFQIICAGPDNEYGGSAYEPPPELGSSGGQRPYLPLIPQRANQSSNGVNQPVLLAGERDNVTNFIDGKLEDYTPQ